MEQLTQTELQELQALRAENAALKLKQRFQGSRIKVSPKGAVSFYGLGKWPLTLFMSQWMELFAHIEEIKAFIQQHASELSVKEQKQ